MYMHILGRNKLQYFYIVVAIIKHSLLLYCTWPMRHSLNLGYQVSQGNMCAHTQIFLIYWFTSQLYPQIPSFGVVTDSTLIQSRYLIQLSCVGSLQSAGWFSLLTGFSLSNFSHFWHRGSARNCLQSCGTNAPESLLKLHFTSIRQIQVILSYKSILWSMQVIIFVLHVFFGELLSKDIHRRICRGTYLNMANIS